MGTYIAVATVILVCGAIFSGFGIMVAKFYRTPKLDEALVVTKPAGTSVALNSGALVLPIIHRAESIDLSPHAIPVHRTGARGLISQDGVRVDVEMTLYIAVGRTENDILSVTESLGSASMSQDEMVRGLLVPKIEAAVRNIVANLDYELLFRATNLRKRLLVELDLELSGFVVQDLAVIRLEHTPTDQLDPKNIHDQRSLERLAQLASVEGPVSSA